MPKTSRFRDREKDITEACEFPCGRDFRARIKGTITPNERLRPQASLVGAFPPSHLPTYLPTRVDKTWIQEELAAEFLEFTFGEEALVD